MSSSMTKPSSSISSIRPSGPGSGLLRPDLLCWGRCSDPPCLVPVMALSADQGNGGSQPRASQTLSCLSARTRLRPAS